MSELLAYCINLDTEIDRYHTIKNEFKGVLDIQRISAIDGKQNGVGGAKALYDTNISILNTIINSDYQLPYIIIIEDDIYKLEGFDTIWPKIKEFIITSDCWDFISLDHFLNFDNPVLSVYNDFLYRVDKSRSAGFMIYNTDFIKYNIHAFTDCYLIDMHIKYNQSYIQLIPKEIIVRQHVNKYSTTENRITDDYEAYYAETEKFLKDYTF